MFKPYNAYRSWIFTCLLASILFSACNSDSDGVDLLFKPQKGFSESYLISEETKNSSVKLKTTKEIRVIADGMLDDAYRMKFNLISVYSLSNYFGEDEIYDSKKAVSEMSGSELSVHNDYMDYLDIPISFKLDSRGKLVDDIDFKGSQSLRNLYFDLNLFQITYPKDKVKVGSTWTNSWQNEFISGKTDVVSAYEVVKMDSSKVEIKLQQAIKVPSLPDKIKEGTYIIDRESGILESVTMTADLIKGGVLMYSIRRLENQ